MNKNDKELLLKLARKAIECSFNDAVIDTTECSQITELRGCFVTIHKHKQLRGCIGFPTPILPLYEQIITAAKAAAFEDPRFPPLDKKELKEIIIEISILTKSELIKINSPEEYLKSITIGKDGLIIKGENSGLLLPQVATENGFDVMKFLECLCQKAGLSKDAWKNLNNKIYRFRAEVFSEEQNMRA